ncbi:hypothetical protein A9995_15390 [Erythrobacter sp. QSSC1-22B]|uniref:nitroreductase family protein n=1 Tax=Erythrobacter sp. QSSC1-22B TaxID=1860125 RepID=UPI000804CEF3|nr:nitroreductase family protein [Erythrobacter sp. QSSC1-22B]OBX17629.1 hypothetical protein A9995_15390 [Erythrobacter sp. QSSC1-22B]
MGDKMVENGSWGWRQLWRRVSLRLRRSWIFRLLSRWVEQRTGKWSSARRLYYGFLSDAFEREFRAVAAGRTLYFAGFRGEKSSYSLRRNIHRLEKGLVARSRRATFGLDFIEDTVIGFEDLIDAFHGERQFTSEVIWARDVLRRYFSSVEQNQKLKLLEERFEVLAGRTTGGQSRPSAPFIRDQGSLISISDLYGLAVQRRSVRSYLPVPVPRGLVDRAMEVALQSPSACNRQPFIFRVFDRPKDARQIAAVAAGTISFLDEINSIIVVVGRLRAYAGERDRHAIYVDASLAAMAFVLGLEVQGVGSCVINWGDDTEREWRINKMLALEPDERVIMMISYGWPDLKIAVPFSAKRGVKESRSFEILSRGRSTICDADY